MGTNYYMFTKSKKLAEKYFPGEYELTDRPSRLGYEIHIGKRSAGWKPLFEQHKKAYDSVKGMLRFMQKHPQTIRIFDEYGKELTVNGLCEELISWGDNQPKEKLSYSGGYLKKFEEGDDDPIYTPIDHVEASKLDNNSFIEINYWHDEYGYDFTDRSFC